MKYAPPIDDILSSLQTVGVHTLENWDLSLAREFGEHFCRFACEVLEPINASGDIEGCRLENGRVYMPEGFKQAYKQLAENGWLGLTAPEEFGGQNMTGIELAIVSEIFSSANHAMQMITGLVPGAIRTLLKSGSQEQKSRLLPRLANGELLATMCLTEPGAGSDLSKVRTEAKKDKTHWQITGEKIFISGGDQDMSNDILHFVLARTSDDALKGLSLFIVEGRVKVIRIERKMGLHASPTCHLEFDQTRAELIGTEGQGLFEMFTMMNHARIDVALQGVAHAARAAYIARHYANERLQGNINGQVVPIIEHADVARMVERAEMLATTARHMVHFALVTLEKGGNDKLVEYLTPLSKIYASMAGMEAAELAMQVLGGYGYLHEYGVDQIYRDVRITAIYEGANGIHAKSLVTRAFKTGSAEAFNQCLKSLLKNDPVYKSWNTAYSHIASSPNALAVADDFAKLSAEVLALALSKYAKNATIRTHSKIEALKTNILSLC